MAYPSSSSHNLGNVRVLGILEELHLAGNKFNITLQVFFVPYILLKIPSNISLDKLSPPTWIAALAFLWGAACMCQGFVQLQWRFDRLPLLSWCV
jgi:hypothetical protein